MTVSAHRILVNSLPKSGTHLLAKAVEAFGYLEHFADAGGIEDPSRVTPMFLNYREVKEALARTGQAPASAEAERVAVGSLTPVKVDTETLAHWLKAVAEGRYLIGHLPWSPALSALLRGLGYRHLCIIRDPRAVAVSLLAFILDSRGMPKPHFLRADFQELSPSQRLDFLLEGGLAPHAGVETQGLTAIYHGMWGWHQDPDCLMVRFEDLVGVQGGGSEQAQQALMARIAAHLEQPMPDSAIYDPQSRTFRRGQIEGWKESLPAESLQRLENYCAPLCKMAGYP
ncbi:MAG: hypothetical protein PHE55_01400 [Methylococcaceae bacterium]|nr:hypothetical protein [Methylococcaceae bacterium]